MNAKLFFATVIMCLMGIGCNQGTDSQSVEKVATLEFDLAVAQKQNELRESKSEDKEKTYEGEISELKTEIENISLELEASNERKVEIEEEISEANNKIIMKLEDELSLLREDILEAEEKNESLSGGMVKALVQARIETLKNTQALVEQWISAIDAGATITVTIDGAKPDEDLVNKLYEEINVQSVELEEAREEESKYSGGLVAAMKSATVATKEYTLSMLWQRYLGAKYGFPNLSIEVSSEEDIYNDTNLDSEEIGEVSAEIVTMTIRNKKFRETDYQEFIVFDIEYTANGLDKPARAIKGVVLFQDLFGETIMGLNWTIDDAIAPNESRTEKGLNFEYNQFKDEHVRMRNTDIENMKLKFDVISIIYEDGTTLEF